MPPGTPSGGCAQGVAVRGAVPRCPWVRLPRPRGASPTASDHDAGAETLHLTRFHTTTILTLKFHYRTLFLRLIGVPQMIGCWWDCKAPGVRRRDIGAQSSRVAPGASAWLARHGVILCWCKMLFPPRAPGSSMYSLWPAEQCTVPRPIRLAGVSWPITCGRVSRLRYVPPPAGTLWGTTPIPS